MKKLLLLLTLAINFISCQKELVDPTGSSGSGPGGGGVGGGGGVSTCTGTKMYLVSKDGGSTLGKDSFAYDSQNRMIYAKFNSAGRVATPAYASFTYDANSRIIKSVVKDVSNNAVLDIYNFTYRTDNKLDSIYASGTPGNNYKLVYNSAGKLIKIIEYYSSSNTSDFNYVITTDANNNITRVVNWDFGVAGDDVSFTYDAKTNPLAGYAFFFAGMDDINDLVTYYGPNNYIDQTAKFDAGGIIVTVVSGQKFDYNNCYPVKDYATISGMVIFPGSPDFIYTYK